MAGRAGLIRLQVGAGDPYCSMMIQPFTPVNLYVTYDPDTIDPAGPDGITGAEFRIEGLHGTFFYVDHPNPAASVVAGSLPDGIHIEFPECMSGFVQLVVATIVAFPPVQSQDWNVRGKGAASDVCPLVRTCDGSGAWRPVYGGRFEVNPPFLPYSCYFLVCSTIAVEARTWSGIKSLYQ